MKKLLKVLILIILGLSLVACSNNQKHNKFEKDGFIKLSERIYVKAENSENEEDIGGTEMLSEIIEEEIKDIVTIPGRWSFHAISSSPGVPIFLQYPDKDIICEISVDAGSLDYYNQVNETVSPPTEKIFWCISNLGEELEHSYMKIVIRNSKHILGYIIIERVKTEKLSFGRYEFNILKSVCFPKVNGKYQTITDKQIIKLFNEIKKK